MSKALIDVVAVVAALIAVVCLLGLLGGSAYDRIGAGGIGINEDDPGGDQLTGREVEDLEIEQMLTARSEREARMGRPPLDVEAEARRLRSGGEVRSLYEQGDRSDGGGEAHRHDPELVRELHQLVIARNERRLRRGEQPLDVEAEVERRLDELSD